MEYAKPAALNKELESPTKPSTFSASSSFGRVKAKIIPIMAPKLAIAVPNELIAITVIYHQSSTLDPVIQASLSI